MTSSRYSIVPSADNKFVTNHKEIQNLPYASNIAIAAQSPDTEEMVIEVAQLTGALTVTAEVVQPRQGDKLTMLFSADSSDRVVTFSTGFALAPANGSTLTVLDDGIAGIDFVFSGAGGVWLETNRYISAELK